MRPKIILGFVAVFFAGIIVAGEPMARGSVEGRLLKATGKVTIERDKAKIAAQPAMEVLGGDIIVTGPKSEASLDLGDGRIITIKENTHFAMDERGPENGDATSGMVYYGMVYARKPAGVKSKPFFIQTPTAVAGTRGTEFGVAVAPDGSSMFGVEEGEITVETDGGASTNVGAMREVVVETDQDKNLTVGSYAADKNALEDWRKNRMEAVLRNPLPAARRLTMTMGMVIGKAENILAETAKQTTQVIDLSNKAREFLRRGQVGQYTQLRDQIRGLMTQLVPMIRRLVRMDNAVQSRGRLLSILLEQATAPGSPTPPRQVQIIEQNINRVKALQAKADKLHQDRAQFMRVRMPELKQATANLN